MNELKLCNVKKIELAEIDNVSGDIFNWSRRQIIITDMDGNKFTINLSSDFLNRELETEARKTLAPESIKAFIDAKSADLHNNLIVNFRNKKI